MDDTATAPRAPRLALLALATLLLGALAVLLFPRAFPTIALRIALTREQAVARATAFANANALAPGVTRTAARFGRDEELLTWVELGAGGKDTLAALVRGRDVALFTWHVRLFEPGLDRGAEVVFAADGRLIGARRTMPDSARRPALAPEAARALADSLLARWGTRDPARWRLAASSERTVPVSGRIDRTFTYERADRRVGGAPIRTEVRVAGDLPAEVHEYVEVPERFQRRYAEMRAANNFLALLAQLAVPLLGILGAWGLVSLGRQRKVRWRPAIGAGAVMAALYTAAILNAIPSAWFDYPTETAPGTWLAQQVIGALAGGAAMGLATAILLAMAEALERVAFPRHVEWWGSWRRRGTREVAGLAAGGYALAAFGFAYTAAFYLVTRTLLGWWVPSDVLDDPNQIATTLPWVTAIAEALRASVQEETLFRAVPLGFLAWRFGGSPHRARILAAGVLGSALVFAFGHANYPSWPPYSRGVELLLEAILWAVVFLRWGLIPTVIAHFVYDLVWFGLFALAGTALAYRVTFAMVLLALLFPALAIAVRAVRARGLVPMDPGGFAGAWQPADRAPREPVPPLALGRPLTAVARIIAVITIALGIAGTAYLSRRPTMGPRFTVTRERAVAIADSVLRARGGDPRGWRTLTGIVGDPQGPVRRLVARHGADSLLPRLAPFTPPAAWSVRYVHTSGTIAERREEWEVRLAPDGRMLEVLHGIPEDAPAPEAPPAAIRAAARTALASAAVDTTHLAERELRLTPRPRRRDARVVYADTTLRLPAGAEARVAVTLAGATPLSVERGIRLSDAFERAERAREDDLLVAGSLAAVALLALLAMGAFRLSRRAPAGSAYAPTLIAGGLALAVVWEVASAANAIPARLADYDTATPWATFRATIALGTAAAALIALVLAGLWYLADEARRRAGIAVASSSGGMRGVLLAGGALGLGPAVVGALAAARSDRLAVPETAMDRLLPVLSPTLEGVHAAMLLLPIVVAAALSVAEMARGGWRTIATLALLSAALIPFVVLADPAVTVARAALGTALGVAITAAALRMWGGQSAAAWVVAALAAAASGGARQALGAGTGVDRWGGALAALVTAAAALLVARAAARAGSVTPALPESDPGSAPAGSP